MKERIRKLKAKGLSFREIGLIVKVSRQRVHQIYSGKSYKKNKMGLPILDERKWYFENIPPDPPT